MGYAGSRKDAGEAVGQSGDSGVDGIIMFKDVRGELQSNDATNVLRFQFIPK
ncbi:MAG TPA: hypothetical protein PKK11_07860 [Methanothrix sp.]|nr:hypothetical protein [Methanothrix sp.]HPT20115.1 hypothetical protein [Methanothrix sp.]